MSDQKLREIFGPNTEPEDRNNWLKVQYVIATALLNGLRRRAGVNYDSSTTPAGLPEVDEIVNTTMVQILGRQNEGTPQSYVWDGKGSFNKFFARCMSRTMEALRSKERRQRDGLYKLRPARPAQATSRRVEEQNIYFAVPGPSCEEQIEERNHAITIATEYKAVLAAAIVDNRVSGKRLAYLENLPRYAKTKMTKAEIASDLGVKPGTVDPFRKRTRELLKKPGDD